jgi:phenylpropionate dioxygenase-like ring-hydroxylating dioxygenase large terminal subunit
MAVATRETYSGYYHRDEPEPDSELTRVGPGTPGGEYLRRFWHPIAHIDDVKDLPVKIRVLGEDLVLFRDGRGAIGLLNLYCSHRGTSLEFGTVERCGLGCCYHGWLYDVDGRVLETPGEPADSTLKDRVVHGAYPVQEYKGLVFTYMGPPEHLPEFPLISTIEHPPEGWRAEARGNRWVTNCNWLQLAENIIDHSHLAFLHYAETARAKLTPYRPSANPEATLDDYFNHGHAEVYESAYRNVVRRWQTWNYEWREFPSGVLSFRFERYGDHVWLRVGDYLMPNIVEFAPGRTQHGIGTELVDSTVGFEPPVGTDWQVPIDDTHTMRLGFAYVPETEDAQKQQVVGETPEGGRQSFSQTERPDYALRQREPGDYEAQQSQREIAVHALEHLGSTDRGVILIRKRLREGIRALQRGEDPNRLVYPAGSLVPSHCRNTILRIPEAATPEADQALLDAAAGRFLGALIAGEDPIVAALSTSVD